MLCLRRCKALEQGWVRVHEDWQWVEVQNQPCLCREKPLHRHYSQHDYTNKKDEGKSNYMFSLLELISRCNF